MIHRAATLRQLSFLLELDQVKSSQVAHVMYWCNGGGIDVHFTAFLCW